MAKKPALSATAARKAADKARAQRTFIKVLGLSCNVSAACRAAKIGRRTAYDWRKADPEFGAAWQDAEDEAVDKLVESVWQRAISGSSDRLAEVLLKGHRPSTYSDRIRAEHTGKDGGPILTEQVTSDADAFTRTIAGLAARSGEGSGTSETEH